MSTKNIFSALAKYNSAADENYLTESFVFVINTLLQRERKLGIEFLNRLCFFKNEPLFDDSETVLVSTQEVTEQGTPDIKISSFNKLIYIEVKHDSPLGQNQIARYKKALEASSASVKHVVLLTRFTIDFEEQEEKPYKNVHWFEVFNWLENIMGKVKDTIVVYLIESFSSFLEAKRMSIQKVGSEYINGIPALNNLMNMIESAVQNVGIPFYAPSPRGAGWSFKGFWLKDKDYWCGIHYNNPSIVTFELIDKKKYNLKLVETPSYSIKEGKKRLWFSFRLEESPFFSVDKDKQLEMVTDFVRKSYSNAQRMMVNEGNNSKPS